MFDALIEARDANGQRNLKTFIVICIMNADGKMYNASHVR